MLIFLPTFTSITKGNTTITAGIYLLKVNNRNTRTYFTPCFSVFIVNFELVIAGWDYVVEYEAILY